MDFSAINGFFWSDFSVYWLIGSAIAILALGFLGAPYFLWTAVVTGILLGLGAPMPLTIAFVAISLIFIIKPLRTILVSTIVMKVMKALGIIPKISETERTALDAGVVWVEKDLFSGKPNFKDINKRTNYPDLSADEQAFIDNQCEKLCAMADDWEIYENRSLPQEVWDYIKKEKFLGMIIPKEYGGLGFSALGHSAVIQKLTGRSTPLGINVMVPNSLGPAELLAHYGTEDQKKKYLPRLATGEEIPCFALTEPTAGSDAGSLTSYGTLFKGDDGGLYVRLNWNKRWITLAALSTILGLAFRLRDPENLLGKGEDVGITCALIPTDTPGVKIGRRHDPLGVPFYNCPTQGKDVVVSVDQIIGGVDGIGKGWQMLMESLAAGRGISLPSQASASGKMCSLVASSHATIRKQFGVSIGKFEGVEEPLAKIGGYNYMLEATRRYTCGAIDEGIKPPVVTAICKYNTTEMMRELVNHAMDILGGAAISRGPRNTVAHAYIGLPIAITVEGANIMTRTLIIFGQGALRAHPFAYEEVRCLEAGDTKGFDRAFWGHIGHIVNNLFRSIVLSWTRGYLASTPGGPLKRYYQKLSWASASFAIMADIAMGALGGSLKMKEKITGRYADILSHMYLATAVIKRFEAEGRKKEDLPYARYALEHSLHEIQKAFDGIFQNLPVPGLSWLFAGPIKAWSGFNTLGSGVSDRISHEVSKAMQTQGEARDRMHKGVFISEDTKDPVGRLAQTFELVKSAEAIERKVKKAIKAKQLPKKRVSQLLDQALAQSIITQNEYDLIKKAEAARYDAIQVDDFSPEEYFRADRKKAPENNMARPVTALKDSTGEPIPNPDRAEIGQEKVSGSQLDPNQGEEQPAV